jgi:hypothetical protein
MQGVSQKFFEEVRSFKTRGLVQAHRGGACNRGIADNLTQPQ